MAINRVDVQGTFIRQDVSQTVQEQDNRAYADMTRLAAQYEQKAEENHIAVTQSEATEAQDQKYDASEEGKNKHLYNNKRKNAGRRDADEPEQDGVVIGPHGETRYGSAVPAFDLKI